MTNNFLKKSIIVIAALTVLVGATLFAYWMSDLSAPEEENKDITVIIGIGDPTGTYLKVIENIDAQGLNFVPVTRSDEDIIDDSFTSEIVFEVVISWDYETEEQGVLQAFIGDFIFYDKLPYVEDNKHSVQLTEEQQQTLKSSFTLELVNKVDDDTYIKEEGHYLINPNKEGETQKIYIRLKFIEDVVDKDIWNLMKDKIYLLNIVLLIEQTIAP